MITKNWRFEWWKRSIFHNCPNCFIIEWIQSSVSALCTSFAEFFVRSMQRNKKPQRNWLKKATIRIIKQRARYGIMAWFTLWKLWWFSFNKFLFEKEEEYVSKNNSFSSFNNSSYFHYSICSHWFGSWHCNRYTMCWLALIRLCILLNLR